MSDQNQLVRYKMQLPQSAAEIRTQINTIQEVMRGVMKPDVHYGVIPGTDKNTLLKPGAEVLLTTFRISVRPEIDDLSTTDCVTYRVRAHGVHMGTDTLVGIGVGECSTNEEKYKWRGASDLEWQNTEEPRRRVKYGWKWGQRQGEKVDVLTKQVRTNPADLANTVLKMAKKRAEVDLCLTALAASDIFTQDIEEVIDNDTGEIQRVNPKAQSREPTRQTTLDPDRAGKATDKQLDLIRMKCERAGITPDQFLEEFELTALDQLPFARVNDALAWIGSAK